MTGAAAGEEGLTRIFADGADLRIAVVLWLLLAGRLCTVSSEEAIGLFFGELFFIVIVFFFVVEVVEVFDIEGGSWLGEVEAFWGGFDVADGAGGVGLGLEAAGVVAGELEAVEESGGSLDFELAGGEGVDDDGEGDLDGFAVLEGGKLDVLAGDEVAAGGLGGAEGGVALVEAVVEVAPGSAGERGGFAAGSVGLDMAT